jgi:hypothetical protein
VDGNPRRHPRLFEAPPKPSGFKALSRDPAERWEAPGDWHASCFVSLGKTGEEFLEDFTNASAAWIDRQQVVELELGCLVAAAAEWTEDEMELDDLVSGLVDSGRVELRIG